jgi:hypothetical protein
MWLSAAYFRSAGFGPHLTIDRDTRQRRMAQARQLRLPNGAVLMNSDPHPIVGWARFLHHQRSAAADLPTAVAARLAEAVDISITIYNHWRPELRYKVIDVSQDQLAQVRRAAIWLRDNHRKLCEA